MVFYACWLAGSDAMCAICILAGLAAIYPYVRALVRFQMPRIGMHNPSALELIGVILYSLFHLLLLGLLFGWHFKLR
jgi:type IV secretory pathway VirB6-like protein